MCCMISVLCRNVPRLCWRHNALQWLTIPSSIQVLTFTLYKHCQVLPRSIEVLESTAERCQVLHCGTSATTSRHCSSRVKWCGNIKEALKGRDQLIAQLKIQEFKRHIREICKPETSTTVTEAQAVLVEHCASYKDHKKYKHANTQIHTNTEIQAVQ